jgi:superfamily II DNA/RNA helicase
MTSFDAFGLAAPLGRALARLDIHVPTPIQAAAIPLLMSGSDLVATAPTGTGKTAAFMLPALHRIASGQGAPGRGPRVLVLAPTRELAQQVDRATQELGRLLPRFSSVCITGGASYQVQNRRLASPHEVLVATPGRFIDQLRAGRIDLARVDTLVLDEADRMLDMGFADDVLQIAAAVPAGRQTVCFTATLSRGVRQLAAGLLRDPQWLSIERAHAERTAIDDHVIYVDDAAHRDRLLQACLRDAGLGQAIVFTATRRHAEELARFLHREGFAAEALHGDLGQRDRNRALERLRRGQCRVLVATDVAARGIDVATVTHVINFQLPRFAEDYVHRIGRTGRAGASGQALSFVGREDLLALRRIEHLIGRSVQVSEIEGHEARFRPSGRESKRPVGGRRHPRNGGPAARRAQGHRPSSRRAATGARGQE